MGEGLGLLEHALVIQGTAELHVAALQALLALAGQQQPALGCIATRAGLPWLNTGFLSHI